jgi:hypothetical protein
VVRRQKKNCGGDSQKLFIAWAKVVNPINFEKA